MLGPALPRAIRRASLKILPVLKLLQYEAHEMVIAEGITGYTHHYSLYPSPFQCKAAIGSAHQI